LSPASQVSMREALDKMMDTALPHVLLWLVAKAQAEVLRERVDRIAGEVLDEFRPHFDYEAVNRKHRGRGYHEELSAESITLKDMFLLHGSEKGKNAEMLEEYYAELAARYEEEKIPPKKKGNCPALEAESDVTDIERKIVKLFAETAGVDWTMLIGEQWKKLIDLVVGGVIAKHPEKVAKLNTTVKEVCGA
jgi:hypothetical protein